MNDCPTDGEGNPVVDGSECKHIAGETNPCATDEVGSGCSGFIDKMMGGGINGLGNDGTPQTLDYTGQVNQKVKILITDTLASTFRWDYHRAVIEGLTNSECELYQQKEAVFEDPYVMEVSTATESLPEDVGSSIAYEQFFGQAPPTITNGIGSARVQVESDKRVYIELKPTPGFVGMVEFNYTIRSCGAVRNYLRTPCALQEFDSGPVPVAVRFQPHECALCTTDECNANIASGDYNAEDWREFNYCGDHGTCYPTGGANGDKRSAGCECELGWRGQMCDIEVESARDDEEAGIWTLVFGLLILALIAMFVNRYIVLGEPLPLFARPLDWPCLVELFPCFRQFMKLPEGVVVRKPGEEPYPEIEGWTKAVDEEGAVYYCSDTTMETRWPQEMDEIQAVENYGDDDVQKPDVPSVPSITPADPVSAPVLEADPEKSAEGTPSDPSPPPPTPPESKEP
eukprot:COSAG02_NODE_5059_length_4681_cov_8.673069_2_plen_457_part_00